MTPAILRRLEGKVDPEVASVIKLLGDGLKDAHDAIASLKGQHDTLAAQVSSVSKTASTAATTAASAKTATQQPVAAGQTRAITASDSVQQPDHLGSIVLQGSTALTVTLNSLVSAPFTTRIVNQSTATATLSPSLSATLNGSSSLAAGASVNVSFDGQNWWAG